MARAACGLDRSSSPGLTDGSYTDDVLQAVKGQARAMTVMLLDAFEWYAYSYVEPEVAQVICGGSDTAAWLLMAVPWMTQPLGGLLVGHFADRCGRRNAMVCSGVLNLVAALGQALTPARPVIGPLWLGVCRALLGLEYGGSETACHVYLAESVPRRALAVTQLLIDVPHAFGYLAISAVMVPFHGLLPRSEMLRWGWRVPFVVGAALATVSLFFRSELEETAEFEAAKLDDDSSSEPDTDLAGVGEYWKKGLMVILGTAMMHSVDGLMLDFLKSWLISHCGVSPYTSAVLLAQSQVVALASNVVAMVVADTYGLATGGLMLCSLGLGSIPLWGALYWLQGGAGTWPLVVLGAGLLHGSCGTPMVWAIDLFPTTVRSSCVGLYYSFGSYIGSVAPALTAACPMAPCVYITAWSAVSMATLAYSARAHRQPGHVLRGGYLREVPY